jgi:hypothetical protein
MSAVAPVNVSPTAPLLVPPLPTPPQVTTALPPPLVVGLEPDDALSQMLLAIQRTGEADMAMTETQIQAARTAVREQLDKYLEQLKQALEAAQKAQEENDDGGFFGSIFDAIGDAVGAIVGTVLDFQWDAFTLPFKTVFDVATHLNDPQAILTSIQSDVLALGKNGDVADSVKGFTSGVVSFTADLSTFAARLTAEVAAAAVTGNNVWDAMKGQVGQLWSSLKSNILDNPQFWEVTGAIAKGAAIAAAVASGGVLAWAAVGLMLVSELDKQTGFIEKTVGKDAAPWVKLGIGVATALCVGFSSAPDQLGASFGKVLQTVQGATGVVQGAGAIYKGIRAYEDAQDRADEVDRQADLQATLNRMQQLDRLTSELLDLLGDQNDDQKTNQELGSDLVQTRAATENAVIMPA